MRRIASVPGIAPGDELGDHRIVVHRDLAAFADTGIDPDVAGGRRRQVAHQPSPSRAGIRARGSPRTPGIPSPSPFSVHVVLLEADGLACRDPDHALDQIEAGHHLGHRMLDLKARVHLQEIEAALAIDDELHGAGPTRTPPRGRARRPCSPIARAGVRVDERRRRLLDDLLVPALDRALALAEVQGISVSSASTWISMWRGSSMYRSMKQAVVAEARTRLAPRALEPLATFGVVAGDPHPLAAAPGAGFEHHRVADLAGRCAPPRPRRAPRPRGPEWC